MNTMLDDAQRNSIIARITLLRADATKQWGKMTSSQMVHHCILWDEMMLGKTKHPRNLLGYLFGPSALNDFVRDDTPMKKNVPTTPGLKVKSNYEGQFQVEKEKWISLVGLYQHFSTSTFIHPFFGRMTTEQCGVLAFKHADHHLRQFNL